MKANIEILDDKELRNHVYNLIEGQVRKIMREEGSDIVKKAVEREVENIKLSGYNFERNIEKYVRDYVLDIIIRSGDNSSYSRRYEDLKKFIRNEIRSCILEELIDINIGFKKQ